jgi:GT2 family glycosyltransferase
MTQSSPRPGTGESSVLVVIVNFNSGPLLAKSVTCIKAQTYTDYRLVVVDNGSTDDSLRLLHERYPDTQILRAGRNLGFAAANNLAVRTYTGTTWIALVNPDAYPEPDWLLRLMEAARKHPEYATFASCTVAASDPALLDGAGDVYHLSGRYWRRGNLRPRSERYLRGDDVFSACAAAALYARAAWDEVRGMDEDYFCYGEDIDLGFRLQLAGHKCLYVPEAIAYHEGSAVTQRRSEFSTYYGQRNLVWTFVKNMPPLLLWTLLPYHLILNLGALGSCVRRGQSRIALKAKIDALRMIPTAWRKRRIIQRTRRVSTGQVWRMLERGWPGPGG